MKWNDCSKLQWRVCLPLGDGRGVALVSQAFPASGLSFKHPPSHALLEISVWTACLFCIVSGCPQLLWPSRCQMTVVSPRFPFLLKLPCHIPLPRFAGTAQFSLRRGASLTQSSLPSFSVWGVYWCISSVVSICYPMEMPTSVSFSVALTVPEDNKLISVLIEYYF